MTAISSEQLREELNYRRTTVITLAPYWISNEIQNILGERALKATREGDVDELRRLTDGIAWLKRTVYVRTEPPAGGTTPA